MCDEVLYAGFQGRLNGILTEPKGFEYGNIVVNHTAYADDTNIISSSVDDLLEKIEWTKEFCNFQKDSINEGKKKTYGYHLNISKEAAAPLNNVCFNGKKINMNSKVLKYLGHVISVDLTVDPLVNDLRSNVLIPILNNLNNRVYPLAILRSIYKELLIPRLEKYLKFHCLPESVISEWDQKIRWAFAKHFRVSYTTIANDAIYSVLDLLPVKAYNVITPVVETMVWLNAPNTAGSIKRHRTKSNTIKSFTLEPKKNSKDRIDLILLGARKYKITIHKKKPISLSLIPRNLVSFGDKQESNFVKFAGRIRDSDSVKFYTSTNASKNDVGVSLVGRVNDDAPTLKMKGSLTVSKSFPYTEIIPIAKAVSIPGGHLETKIYTKLVGLDKKINEHKNGSYRKKVTTGGAILMETILRSIEGKKAIFTARDPKRGIKRFAECTGLADTLAKKARINGPAVKLDTDWFGLKFYVKIQGVSIQGNLRKELKEFFQQSIHDRWLNQGGSQSKNWREAGIKNNDILKMYGYEVELLHLLTNTTPSGRHYANAREDCLSNCPMCTYEISS